MTFDQIIFVNSQGWTRFADGQATELKPWTGVHGTTVLAVDFADSFVGVQASKGKPEYAAAQIEKSVRSEGGLEGPLQVFVHKQLRHAGSTLTFYTAIPLLLWQQLQDWCNAQPDHCLVIPLAGLLPTSGLAGRAQIFRSGAKLMGYRASATRIWYAEAAVLGSGAAEQRAPLRALMIQLDLNSTDGAVQLCDWGLIASEDVEAERRVTSTLAEGGVLQADMLPQTEFAGSPDRTLVTALPYLLDRAPAKVVQAPWLSRLAWMSEAYVVPLGAMIVVVALGLGALAYVSQNMAADEQKYADGLQSEIAILRARVAVVERLDNSSVNVETRKLVSELAFAASHNPVQMLAAIRRAAGSDVRIQRLQLVKASSGARPHFRVDGVVTATSNESLGRFLANMRMQGWQAESAAPTDSTSGAFAYILQPIAAKQS